ncbi:MAG: hypothetical protein KJN99_03300, partial [Marinicaulis sp.]|nr:hypothetical protein [Marinicaulis sp.]
MKLKTLLLAGSSAMLMSACETVSSQDGNAADAAEAETMASFEAEGGGQWPPAGCMTPTALQQFITANPNYQPSYYLGLYSGDENMLQDGNTFYLGSNHGENVQPPNSALTIAPTPAGTGVMLRWNNSDRYKDPASGDYAPGTVSNHYSWDYDTSAMTASTDGIYAYDALAV